MEEFRSPGTHSSVKPELDPAIAALTVLPAVQKIKRCLDHAAQLHIVGGTLRNVLSGQGTTDIDLATALLPEQVQKRLEENSIRVVPTGLKHGTVTAVIDHSHLEITTFRSPTGRTGALSIEEDLAGRDFTINAMALRVDNGRFLDPFNGKKDLEAAVLRAVGDPTARFKEDPLRILRMVRFGPADHRAVEPQTVNSATNLVSTLSSVSVERIREEFSKILVSDAAGASIKFMASTGILDYVLPELKICIGFEQNEFHSEDLFEHTLTVLDKTPKDLILRLSALYHDIGKAYTLTVDEDGGRHFYNHEVVSAEICEKSMHRLKFSNEQIDRVSKLVRMHMRPIDCGTPGVRRLLRELETDFDIWLAFKRADTLSTKIEEREFEAQLTKFNGLVEVERNRKVGSIFENLAIDGYDLMDLGVKPGPIMGKLLKRLLDQIIADPESNTREKLTYLTKELLNDPEYSE